MNVKYFCFQCSIVEIQHLLNSFDKYKLMRFREDLVGCVNPDDLVKELQESNIALSSLQKKKLTLKKTPQKRAKYLLDVLTVLPDNAFQALVNLLIKANQPILAGILKDRSGRTMHFN